MSTTATEVNPITNTETWETATASQVAVNRYVRGGGEKATIVGGEPGKRVQVTTAERIELNEEAAASDDLDPFKNGFLRPVRGVPQDVKDRFKSETLQQGGHTVEQLVEILELVGQPFNLAVGKLNEATLRRLAEVAPEMDAKASQISAIDAALEKFKVELRQTAVDKQLRAAPQTPGGNNDNPPAPQ